MLVATITDRWDIYELNQLLLISESLGDRKLIRRSVTYQRSPDPENGTYDNSWLELEQKHVSNIPRVTSAMIPEIATQLICGRINLYYNCLLTDSTNVKFVEEQFNLPITGVKRALLINWRTSNYSYLCLNYFKVRYSLVLAAYHGDIEFIQSYMPRLLSDNWSSVLKDLIKGCIKAGRTEILDLFPKNVIDEVVASNIQCVIKYHFNSGDITYSIFELTSRDNISIALSCGNLQFFQQFARVQRFVGWSGDHHFQQAMGMLECPYIPSVNLSIQNVKYKRPKYLVNEQIDIDDRVGIIKIILKLDRSNTINYYPRDIFKILYFNILPIESILTDIRAIDNDIFETTHLYDMSLLYPDPTDLKIFYLKIIRSCATKKINSLSDILACSIGNKNFFRVAMDNIKIKNPKSIFYILRESIRKGCLDSFSEIFQKYNRKLATSEIYNLFCDILRENRSEFFVWLYQNFNRRGFYKHSLIIPTINYCDTSVYKFLIEQPNLKPYFDEIFTKKNPFIKPIVEPVTRFHGTDKDELDKEKRIKMFMILSSDPRITPDVRNTFLIRFGRHFIPS